ADVGVGSHRGGDRHQWVGGGAIDLDGALPEGAAEVRAVPLGGWRALLCIGHDGVGLRRARPRMTGAGWPRVARLALVQASIGGIVVLMTSTLNRVMVVELSLPAAIPGILVALQYALQLSRPYTGFGSD